MQTDSELESDTSSINDGIPGGGSLNQNLPLSREQLEKRIESLVQENRVLKIEIDTYKLRVKALQEENKELRKASVNIQARAEQEEEYISNKLLKKIQSLKKEKETLANNYEREEEYLTNDLSRKLNQLRNEKVQLEQTLEQEQEHMVNKLMRKIEKLEAETSAKQTNLEQLRREKIELENTLEQEQESLVNRLWKRMERLEAEKRLLQEKLDQPVSAPMSPRNSSSSSSLINPPGALPTGGSNMLPIYTLPGSSEQAANLTEHIINLRREVSRLKANLEKTERDHKENMAKLIREEKVIKEENLRLQRRLQMEVDRREALCRHLSESESSLEMDDERHFNESSRVRTVSSPIPGYLIPPTTTTASNTTHTVTNPSNLSNNSTTQPSNSLFTQPIIQTSIGPATSVVAPSVADRCPTCNQLKTLLINNSHLISPPQLAQSALKQPQTQLSTTNSVGTSSSGFGTLTSSSSLSSSSSSINNNNTNLNSSNLKFQQVTSTSVPINNNNNNLTDNSNNNKK